MTTLTSASAGATLGSVLKTVQTTADTITNIVGGASKAGDMFNRFMSDALERQKINSENDMAIYEITTNESAEFKLANQRREILEFIDSNPQNKSLMEKAAEDLARVKAERAAR